MYIYIYIHIYIYIYNIIYIYIYILISQEYHININIARVGDCRLPSTGYRPYTPSPPTKSFPTKSPRVKLSGRLPMKFNGHENSHPLELRVCPSQTL